MFPTYLKKKKKEKNSEKCKLKPKASGDDHKPNFNQSQQCESMRTHHLNYITRNVTLAKTQVHVIEMQTLY